MHWLCVTVDAEKKTLGIVLDTRGEENDEESWMYSVSILMCDSAYYTIH